MAVKQFDRDREAALRSGVSQAIAGLRDLADVSAEVLEDHVRGMAAAGHALAEGRLKQFEEAVNLLWLFAENSGLTHALAAAWWKVRRKQAEGTQREDVDAEATFAMRRIVVQYGAHATAVPLYTFARLRMQQELDRWLAGERGVPHGRSSAEIRHTVHSRPRRLEASVLEESLADSSPQAEQQLLLAERAGVNVFKGIL